MTEWITQALAAARRGDALAMVSIVGVQGSTPREPGARMLVGPDRVTGTIGRGALERHGLGPAPARAAQAARRHALQDYPLGPLLGQCCGGHVRLLVERIDDESLPWLEAAAGRTAPFALAARFEDGALRRAVEAVGAPSDGPRTPLAEVRSMSETIRPAVPRLAIFGAGHVGQAVARAFAPLPFHLDWLASREDLRPEAGGTRAEILSEDELEDAALTAPAGTLFAIFTHSHDLDYRLTRAILGRGDFAYLGLTGSATKRVRFERRLRADGFGDADLARLACPLGAPQLKSKAPAVIAVALAAQLLQIVQDDGLAQDDGG